MSMLVCIRVILKTVVLVEHRGTTYCWALRGQHTKTISVGTRSVEHPELRIAKVHTKTRQRLTPQISKHVPFFTIPPQTFEIKRGRPLNWIASRFCGTKEPLLKCVVWSLAEAPPLPPTRRLLGGWKKRGRIWCYKPTEKTWPLEVTSLGESRNQELQNNRNIHFHFQFFWVKRNCWIFSAPRVPRVGGVHQFPEILGPSLNGISFIWTIEHP